MHLFSYPRTVTWRTTYLLVACVVTMALCACLTACGGGGFNHKELPLLPPKNWLNPDSKEQSAENTVKLSTSKKNPSFIDLVYWAVQESPVISRSSIDLDLRQISLSDEKWKYLPEFHALFTVSNNITRYNTGLKDDPRHRSSMKGYGEIAYQLTFSGTFNNPVATFFSVKAQEELMAIAIETHKKVVEECITDIASIIVQMKAKAESIELMQEFIDVLRKHARHAEKSDKYTAQIWTQTVAPKDKLRDMELQLETARMELAMLRNQLKLLVGLDRDTRLDVDLRSVERELREFDPSNLTWEHCWNTGTERFLLMQQVRLHDAGIMLAWARYVPDISLAINESPPKGQSQPADVRTDQFLHLTFDFPLLDWGHRYRGAATASAEKRQSLLDMSIKEREYRNKWFTTADTVTLHRHKLKQRELAVEHAQRRVKALKVAFENGQAAFPEVVAAHQDLYDARQAIVVARENLRKATLDWMNLAHFFRNKYLQNSAKGK